MPARDAARDDPGGNHAQDELAQARLEEGPSNLKAHGLGGGGDPGLGEGLGHEGLPGLGDGLLPPQQGQEEGQGRESVELDPLFFETLYFGLHPLAPPEELGLHR
ncbi:MAG: hypothetical protein II424_02975, partial [Bacteroidales bacterium]|nr:hypothetical protein [Bacteroidales bacterium]